MTNEELSSMLRQAYEAMSGENMSCPWCTGRISATNDWHDQFCPWLEISPKGYGESKVDEYGNLWFRGN